MAEIKLEPIIRWVGGKSRISNFIFSFFSKEIDNYIEPFFGSGALMLKTKANNYYANDLNIELINFYKEIKKDYSRVVDLAKGFILSKDNYIRIRELDRQPDFYANYSPLFRSARFYFLNKTSFQGMWRVNKNNHNNVPYGNYKKINFNENNIANVSKFLNNVKFTDSNFENSFIEGSNNFYYIDPPYIPVSKTSSFVGYVSSGFAENDHFNVKLFCDKIHKSGSKFVLSNSFCDTTETLYSEYDRVNVYARRSISANVDSRKPIKELLIKNF